MTYNYLKNIYHLLKWNFQALIYKLLYPDVQLIKNIKSKESYSQFGQDIIIKKLLSEYGFNNGVIIDIGCNKPFLNNNSALFEQDYKTFAIDLLNLSSEWEKRPNSNFFRLGIGSINEKVNFFSVTEFNGWESQMSGLSKPPKKFSYSIEEINVTTLNQFCNDNNICKILFLLIDVEGYEYEVLKEFNFFKYSPDIILLENLSIHGSRKIDSLLSKNGYKKFYRIWTTDDLYMKSNLVKVDDLF